MVNSSRTNGAKPLPVGRRNDDVERARAIRIHEVLNSKVAGAGRAVHKRVGEDRERAGATG